MAYELHFLSWEDAYLQNEKLNIYLFHLYSTFLLNRVAYISSVSVSVHADMFTRTVKYGVKYDLHTSSRANCAWGQDSSLYSERKLDV